MKAGGDGQPPMQGDELLDDQTRARYLFRFGGQLVHQLPLPGHQVVDRNARHAVFGKRRSEVLGIRDSREAAGDFSGVHLDADLLQHLALGLRVDLLGVRNDPVHVIDDALHFRHASSMPDDRG
jgi:hypothetical protein